MYSQHIMANEIHLWDCDAGCFKASVNARSDGANKALGIKTTLFIKRKYSPQKTKKKEKKICNATQHPLCMLGKLGVIDEIN